MEEPEVIDAEFEEISPATHEPFDLDGLAILITNLIVGGVLIALVALIQPPLFRFFYRLFGAS